MEELASRIDHTLLKPEATQDQIITLCQEALEHKFASVCVPPNMVALASSILENSSVLVCTVIGFPLGYSTTPVKVFEANEAIDLGAQEIDMVIAINEVKSGNFDYVRNEIEQILTACHSNGALLKVIVETALLTDEEKVIVYDICAQLKVDFVKTSTGFSTHGATIKDVELMRKTLPDSIKIKASGGIKDANFANELVQAGADRLGTSSGINIIKK